MPLFSFFKLLEHSDEPAEPAPFVGSVEADSAYSAIAREAYLQSGLQGMRDLSEELSEFKQKEGDPS